jgi:predicted membrane metal-binding protein
MEGGPARAIVALVCVLVLTGLRTNLNLAGAALIVLCGLLVGLTAGNVRLAAIDATALRLDPGTEVSLTGYAQTAPRFSRGIGRFVLDSKQGRVMVESPSVPRDVPVGAGVKASGVVRPPPDWYQPNLERQGLELMLYAGSVALTGESRRGLAGLVDRIRIRAEDSLSRGMPDREAALARGFVLGQDQEIDPLTVTDFQNSGLAHLLSCFREGQNTQKATSRRVNGRGHGPGGIGSHVVTTVPDLQDHALPTLRR